MGCVNVYLVDNLTQAQVTALQALAVDMGDRRVFAGVHYPSDNLLSWFVALSVIPCVARDEKKVTDFVVDAVRTSLVYQEMKKNPSYAAALTLVQPWGL